MSNAPSKPVSFSRPKVGYFSNRPRMSFPFDLHNATVTDSDLPCHARAMLRPCRSSQSYITARPSIDGRPCCGLEKNGMVGAWHGHGMASVNQTLSHCVNEMGKTHSKRLAARHGRRTAWARHATYESAFRSEYIPQYPKSGLSQCENKVSHPHQRTGMVPLYF